MFLAARNDSGLLGLVFSNLTNIALLLLLLSLLSL